MSDASIAARFETDFDVVIAPASFDAAWRRVRANRGAAGGDLVSLDTFAKRLGRNLDRLGRDLAAGAYRPGPLRRCAIAKPSGGKRVLRIPSVRDRVIQTACNSALIADLDPTMSPLSFGYRPGRSVEQALAEVKRLGAKRPWVADCDIEQFFDAVPHILLQSELQGFVADQRLRNLIGLWLKGFGGSRGLAQGAPISPLLANLHLDPLDRLMARAELPMVRYADDFVIMARTEREAARALRLAAAGLEKRGLALSREKSAVRRLGAELVFLGHRFKAPPEAVSLPKWGGLRAWF